MYDFMNMPEWIGTAVIGAVIATLGYVGKIFAEFWIGLREAENTRRARLVELRSLLRASKVSFTVQNDHAQCLLLMIKENHPAFSGDENGYEYFFSHAYSEFTPEEKELHEIIRGITVYAMYPTNLSLSNWLKSDTYFKSQRPSKGILGALAVCLFDLESHLILWHAKYETWIPDTTEHALVYMADEVSHGLRFPSEIDDVVSRAISRQWLFFI